MKLKAIMRKWLRRTLVYHIWLTCRERVFRSVVLPRMKSTSLHGVELGLENISSRMRENLVRGNYETAEVQLCRRILKPDDKVVEIGSAIGFLGLFSIKQLRIIDFFSIEANPETARLLKENYARNGIECRLLVAALAPVNGPLNFYVTEDFWTNSARAETSGGAVEKVTVRGCRLPAIIAEAPFTPTALIIDVEGGEACLMNEVLPKEVQRVIIELHPKCIGLPAAFSLLQHFMNQGFEVIATCDDSYALQRKLS